MNKNEVFLDSYALQKDLRIKLPKQIITNLPVDIGSVFDIYINTSTNEVILRIAQKTMMKGEHDE